MIDIAQNIRSVRSTLPDGVELLCVSKFHSADSILQAYNAGERLFGESRAQELSQKQSVLPKDIQWHFIGHLQTNKIRTILPFVSLIHGVDSPHLLEAINSQAVKQGVTANVLLEVHVAKEATKYGFTPQSILEYMSSLQWQTLNAVRICGIMGMATNTDDESQIHIEFAALKSLFDNLKQTYFPSSDHFRVLSMGMSDDYLIAAQHGSTMVRIGTSIFGQRQY